MFLDGDIHPHLQDHVQRRKTPKSASFCAKIRENKTSRNLAQNVLFSILKIPLSRFPIFVPIYKKKRKKKTKIFRAKKYPISKQSDENPTKNIAYVTTTISGLPQICLKPRNFASFGRQIGRTRPHFFTQISKWVVIRALYQKKNSTSTTSTATQLG